MRTIKVRAAVAYDPETGAADVAGWLIDGSLPADDEQFARMAKSNLDSGDGSILLGFITAELRVPEAFEPREVGAAIERRE